MTLLFGVYAGGLGADEHGDITPGPPEDAQRIAERLDELHGDRPFLVRGYVQYSDADGAHLEAPPAPWQHAVRGRRLDLVACFREPGDDLTGWLAFLRSVIRTHGETLATLQVGEEANHDGPGGDGGRPAVRRAIVEGVLAARDEIDRLGLDVRVGCNSTPVFDPAQEFWTGLGRLGGSEFTGALDYAGLDFFPDVFRAVPDAALTDAVRGVLHGFRHTSLAAAGVPDRTPIHVTENGWATGPDRSPERQAEVLDRVVRIVDGVSAELGITAYEHFALRDADSAVPDTMYQFGLVRSDYTPKPAFHRYGALIRELG
ncbi:hypothetical protein GCM10010399_35490 [Dactylosporangium fulvum]|uniref:Uncharacterized protein n=1 Tax=Dactylosporangium fulvum TaxID=53359 RepID=A0ABY5W6H8_9ACTN|nr:hypothetical protein [Dactylosporangium fulvum]UWP84965.1 hypothetical protein Dfulv_12350 [Dactylosporangium fulvum]